MNQAHPYTKLLSAAVAAGMVATLAAQATPPAQPAPTGQPARPVAPGPPQGGQPAPPAPPTAGQPAPGQPAAPAAPAQPAAPQGPGATPTKPLVPMAASTLARNPDPYYGEFVSLTATVEQTISGTAFSVDQDKTKSTGKNILVLAPRLNKPVQPNTYVVVLGEVVRFDSAELGTKFKGFAPDLTAAMAAQYQGQPAILATAVLTEASENLAMRLPPAMGKDETALSEAMKKVGASNGALRKAIEASSVDLAREHALVLKQSFNKAESFMRSHGKPDAVKWAQDAKRTSETIERAATAGKWDEVKASAGELGKACQTCHTAYRERFDDGSFRFKAGTPGTK